MERIHGTLTKEEKSQWRKQMEADGFSKMWTWIRWVLNTRSKIGERRNKND